MILNRYILKETIKMQVIFYIILNAIFLCQSFIQILRSASKGDIPAQLVTEMLMLSIPNMSILMIPLTVYLGILVAHARLGADSEFVVMKSLGVTPFSILKGAFILGVFTAVVALFNSLYLVPKAQAKQESLLQDARENSSYFAINSGQIIRFGNNRLIAYIDDVNDEKSNKVSSKKDLRKMENVYLFMPQTSRQKRPTTIGYAEKGYVTQDEDNIMWLVLEDGTFYIGPNEKNKYTKMDYDEYRTQLADNSQDQNEIKINAVPTSELLTMSGPVATAELQWRLCVALAIPILTLIVVPLANVRPRQGKFAKFLPALMIYGSFFLLMVSLKHLISKGIFPAFPGLYILIFAYFVLFAVPLNMTETKWYKKYQLQKIRKQSDKSNEIKN